MMDVLLENMSAGYTPAKASLLVSFVKLPFWTPERIDLVRDRILAAISARRHGDSKEWDVLDAMEPEEWIDWLRSVGTISN